MMSRTAEQMGGSLKKYATQEYDFDFMPQNGKQVSDEHIQKIIDPLLEINDFLQDNSLKKERTALEMTLEKAENFADKMLNIQKDAKVSGCRGNCTGLCELACASACTGCTSCSGNCSTTCGKQCSDGCSGGCGGCTGGCSSGCTHTCGAGCTTSIKA